MKVRGPWYGEIAVMEKLDGMPVTVYISNTQFSGGTRARDHAGGEGFVCPNAPGDGEPHAAEFGYTDWAKENAGDLFRALGYGRHSGIWWGEGIGRGYNVPGRYFALYAPKRLPADNSTLLDDFIDGMAHAPVLYRGPMSPENGQDPVGEALRRLQFAGSAAARGFKPAAGVIVTNLDAGVNFSVDLD